MSVAPLPDVVLLDGEQRYTSKTLTTPTEPEQGVLQGIEENLKLAGRTLHDVDLLILGTTLATNALIERKGARTALIITQGGFAIWSKSVWKTASRRTMFSCKNLLHWCRAIGALASPNASTRRETCCYRSMKTT